MCRLTSDQLVILQPFSVISGNFRWFLVISNYCGDFQKNIIKVWGKYLNQLPSYGWQLFFKQDPAVLGQFFAFFGNLMSFLTFPGNYLNVIYKISGQYLNHAQSNEPTA